MRTTLVFSTKPQIQRVNKKIQILHNMNGLTEVHPRVFRTNRRFTKTELSSLRFQGFKSYVGRKLTKNLRDYNCNYRSLNYIFLHEDDLFFAKRFGKITFNN